MESPRSTEGSEKDDVVRWDHYLWEEIKENSKNGFTDWVKIVNNIGFDEATKQHWIAIYKEEFVNLTQGLVKDASEFELAIKAETSKLYDEYYNLCSYLKVARKSYSSRKYTLIEIKKKLQFNIEKLKEIEQNRLKTVKKLVIKEKELCKQLGLSPKGMSPEEDVSIFEEYINELDNEIYTRSEKFMNYKCEILDYINILNLTEVDEFYGNMLTADENCLVYSLENLNKLEEFYYSLKNEVDVIKNKILDLKKIVEELWDLTGENQGYRDNFMEKYGRKISYSVFEEFNKEIYKLRRIKEENFKNILQKLRDEIVAYWNICKFTQDQRLLFKHFHYFLQDDVLLHTHNNYLSSLKEIYENNRELFSLIDKLEEACKDYYTRITKNVNTNDRYKNRGGCLLQEEREKNMLKKKISKLEEKIKKSIESFKCTANLDFNVNHIAKYIELLFKNSQIKRTEIYSAKKYNTNSLNLLTPSSTLSLKSCCSTNKSNLSAKSSCSNLSSKKKNSNNSETSNEKIAKKALFTQPITEEKENFDDLALLMNNKFKLKNSMKTKSKRTSFKHNVIKKAKIKSTKYSRMERTKRLSIYLKTKRGFQNSTMINDSMFKGITPIEETSVIELVP